MNSNVAIEYEVVEFLCEFQRVVMKEVEPFDYDNHHDSIQDLYENYWNKLTERYFKSEPWPEPVIVQDAFKSINVEMTDVFRILYTELYYRHVYASGQAKGNNEFGRLSFERYRSWENYVEFFNLIINTTEVPKWTLPSTWLWDIMDEFIYQFTQYRQFRSRMQHKSKEELDFLEQYGDNLWGIHSVLNVMHSIVDKSKIVQSLQAYQKQADEEDTEVEEIDSFGNNLMYKFFGYFSLIGLLRFHVLIGDYQLAIDSIKAIPTDLLYDLQDHEWFIMTHYYYAFALIMMRKYQTGIMMLQEALNFIERSNRSTQRQIKYKIDQQNKQVEQLYHLLSICVTLFPMKLDDSIEQKMNKKVGVDKLSRMQDGEEKAFDECYNYVCPKFVPLGSPPLDSKTALNFANGNLQKKVFMDEIRSQLQLPAIRRYLKLYTTMELPKLSSFLSKNDGFDGQPSETATLSYLMCCKVKMAMAAAENFDKTCPSTSKILAGRKKETELTASDENAPSVDFYVDGKMVHIADTKVEWTFGRNFMKLIHTYHKMEGDAKRVGKSVADA